MVNFIEGTLLISNILLILVVLVYGFLIIKKHKKEESSIWVYFLIACSLYFLSELVTLLDKLMFMDITVVRGILRLSFGIIILFAFLSKYESLKK